MGIENGEYNGKPYYQRCRQGNILSAKHTANLYHICDICITPQKSFVFFEVLPLLLSDRQSDTKLREIRCAKKSLIFVVEHESTKTAKILCLESLVLYGSPSYGLA